MTTVIGAFGSVITITASNTVPTGYVLTQFADDTDPLDIPSLQIGNSSMGVNGDLLVWSTANPIKVNISLVPNGADDRIMGIIFEANRVGQGKLGANDIITLNVVYPNGTGFTTYSKGKITDGMPATSFSSEGRFKTKTYSFSFQNKIGI